MTATNRKLGLSLVLAHEGGYVNHPRDPGGATNQGVTQRVYDAYRTLKGRPRQSVRNMVADEVADIYTRQYWNLVRGDDLPAGLDYAVFDFAVNSGPARAIRYLQSVVGLVGDDIDGLIGMGTLAAVNKAVEKDEEAVITALCDKRLAFVRGLDTFDVFGKGWTRRIVGEKAGAQPGTDKGVIDYAIMLARNDPTFVMPAAIGVVQGEVAAKAMPPISYADAVAKDWGLH